MTELTEKQTANEETINKVETKTEKINKYFLNLSCI